MRAFGTTTRDSAALRSLPGYVATMSTTESGPILPATPVSASTRIASSRWPGRELRRRHEHVLLQQRVLAQRRRGDDADELAGVAQRRRRRPARRHLDLADHVVGDRLERLDGLGELQQPDLRVDLLAHVGDVAGDQHEHDDQAQCRDRHQQQPAALARVHAVTPLSIVSACAATIDSQVAAREVPAAKLSLPAHGSQAVRGLVSADMRMRREDGQILPGLRHPAARDHRARHRRVPDRQGRDPALGGADGRGRRGARRRARDQAPARGAVGDLRHDRRERDRPGRGRGADGRLRAPTTTRASIPTTRRRSTAPTSRRGSRPRRSWARTPRRSNATRRAARRGRARG